LNEENRILFKRNFKRSYTLKQNMKRLHGKTVLSWCSTEHGTRTAGMSNL